MVESSRRDFLKMLGIGAAVAIAPNVIVAPEILAMPVENVIIDKMKLNYFIGDKIYPLGFLEDVSVTIEEPPALFVHNIATYRTRIIQELQFSVRNNVDERHNINKIFDEMHHNVLSNTAYQKDHFHKISGRVITRRYNTGLSDTIDFTAEGILVEYNDVINFDDFTENSSPKFIANLKFRYHKVEVTKI